MSETTTQAAAVTVVPERFTLVDFEAAAIAEVAATMLATVGLPADLPLRVEVDETTPLGRAWVLSADPAVIKVESGGMEDAYRPRQFSPDEAAPLFGRLMFRLQDRLDPAFAEAPDEDDLSLPLAAAWDVYAVGRVARLGYPSQRQRRLYQFRVRHGFTDVADAAFDELWAGDGLSWADIERLSATASAASE